MKTERKKQILDLIEQNGRMSYDELMGRFPNVSGMTIRRDLYSLEEKGAVIRVRGGAISINELSKKTEEQFFQRAGYNVAEKKQIAEKATKLLGSTKTLFIDSGSTTLYFAKELSDINYYIVTNGLNIALELTRKSMPMVTLLGGEVSRNNLATSGMQTAGFLDDVNIEVAVMTTTAFSVEEGFTCGSKSEADIKHYVMTHIKKRIMLLDSSKLMKSMPFTFARFSDVDVLVTDSNFPEELRRIFEAKGIQVV